MTRTFVEDLTPTQKFNTIKLIHAYSSALADDMHASSASTKASKTTNSNWGKEHNHLIEEIANAHAALNSGNIDKVGSILGKMQHLHKNVASMRGVLFDPALLPEPLQGMSESWHSRFEPPTVTSRIMPRRRT